YLDIHNKANEVQNAKTNHQNKVRDLDKKLSDKATRNSDSIKNQHERFGNIRYDKRSLEADIFEVLHNNYQQLNLTQIELFENTVRQRKLSAPPELSPYTLNFSSLITSTNDILKSVVGSSEKIDELKNNPSLNSWAQIGHPLHNDRTTCAFCNNEISDQRRKELANHFDEETDKLRDRISKGIQYLDKLLSNSPLNISFDMTNYYQQYHPELSQLQTNLQNAFAKQKSSIELLKKSLEDKDKKLFSELSIEHPQDHSTEIKTILERISQIRTECIQKNDQLYSLQNEAKNALRLDHIYLFLQSINYTQLTSDIDLAFEAIAPLEIELATLQT
ncbi:AAA family ATPase, partial [Acinetobacter johnsonii]|uniref:AAA family ATPase n=2 Tax=Acinetobacter TaxID=469 RepID=UPI00300A3484